MLRQTHNLAQSTTSRVECGDIRVIFVDRLTNVVIRTTKAPGRRPEIKSIGVARSGGRRHTATGRPPPRLPTDQSEPGYVSGWQPANGSGHPQGRQTDSPKSRPARRTWQVRHADGLR